MGKILVLGNERSKQWAASVDGAVYEPMPSYSLGEDGEGKLSEFVVNNFDQDVAALVLDVDNIQNNELCFALILCLRLSVLELKEVSLIPVMLMSNNQSSDQYKLCNYASLLFTKGVYSDTVENVVAVIGALDGLTLEEYHSGFLNIIKVNPNATEGRHSLANQWGADVLNRIVIGGITKNISIQKARTSLYFKYILMQTLKGSDMENIIHGKEANLLVMKKPAIKADGKKIMLIDDEADKGWSDVLQMMFRDTVVYTVCERVKDYESLSENARREIETGDYDLIFLDLRMNGVEEENIFKPEDFSGMKILHAIKNQNPGTQVIMFTASNKAWNLKALLDAGANGYYIKESPEYLFPIKYSENNAETLRSEIVNCLSKSYLRKIHRDNQDIKNHLNSAKCSLDFKASVANQLDVAYNLLEQAKTEQQFAHAYVALEQILEMISAEFIKKDTNGNYIIIKSGEECSNYVIDNGVCSVSKEPILDDFAQWKRIVSLYYQLWGGTDISFGSEIQNLIEKRNAFMHNDEAKLKQIIYKNARKEFVHRDIYAAEGCLRLHNVVINILSYC